MWMLFGCLTLPRDAIFVAMVWLWVPFSGAAGLARAQLSSGIYFTAVSAILAYGVIRNLRNRLPNLRGEPANF